MSESRTTRQPRRNRDQGQDLSVGLAASLAAGVVTSGVALVDAVAVRVPAGPVAAVWLCGVAAVALLVAMLVLLSTGPGSGRGGRGRLTAVAVVVGVAGLWLCLVAAAAIAAGDPAVVLFSLVAVATTIVLEVRVLRARTTRIPRIGPAGTRS